MMDATVIGAGLAGCEAAWQLARRGVHVTLREMKPREMTPALDRRMDVRLALDHLPPELRETAVLYFCQELPQRQIAAILGIGLSLVKYRVRRSRELLSLQLGKEEL